MKTSSSFHILLLLMLLTVLMRCHLEEIPSPGDGNDQCVTNLPNASFDVNVTNCDKPCTIVVTNTSSGNSIGFQWYFGDSTQTTLKDPPDKVYAEAGEYEIMLVVKNTEGCTDTSRQSITVNEGNAKFKAILNTGPLNATPYAVAELQNGKFHVAYDQSGLKTAFVDKTGSVEGTPANIPLTMSINQMMPYNGGFVASGESPPKAKIAVLDAGQSLGIQPEFQFPSAASSLASSSMVNPDDEIVVTGFKVTSVSEYIPGFARYSKTGVVLANEEIKFTGTSGYGGASVTQRPSGEYLIAANCLTSSCTIPCVVFSVTDNGGYNGKFNLPLTTVLRIVALSNDTYAVIGYSGSIPKVVGITGGGTELWNKSIACTEVADVVAASDGNIVVCGTKQNALYYAKLPTSAATQPIWEKQVAETDATIYGYALIGTSDDGFAILGQIITSGVKKLYLIKSDDKGEYQ